MTNMQMCPPVPANAKRSFLHDIFKTTLSYMLWGYGAMFLSIIAYGIYELAIGLDRSLMDSGVRLNFLAWALTGLILSAGCGAVVWGTLSLIAKFKRYRVKFHSDRKLSVQGQRKIFESDR